jgi:hypothetical protein
MGFGFMLAYVFYYNGGDNTAFWQGGVKLNKLFFDSPSAFFADFFNFNKYEPREILTFVKVGYPPGWIFREYEAWFVCKMVSVLSFVTFRSYIATSLILTYFVGMASWRFLELVTRQNFISKKHAVLAVFFIPSVGFWCSGITKDALSFIAILYWLVTVFGIFNGHKKLNIKSILVLFLCFFIMTNIRGFLFYVIVLTSVLGLAAGYQKKLKNNFLFLAGYVGLLIVGIGLVSVIAVNSSLVDSLNESEYLEEAEIKSGDFERNTTTYGDSPRYSLGVSEFTIFGIVKVLPLAILTAVYRPLIYEALSFTLLLNGIESLVLLWFTMKFLFNGSVVRKIGLILSNEVLSFALYFTGLFGFMVGLTSILFGVLVRFRAPILPFFVLILLSGAALYAKEQIEMQKNNEDSKSDS